LVVALIAFCSASTATSSSATIFHDRNAVHQQEAFTYGILSTVAGSTTEGAGSTQNGVLATAAKLVGPSGITMDATGNLYISDKNGHRVMKVTTSTGLITAVAGTGVAGYSGDGGEAVNAKIDSPVGIELDKSGNIYFADPALHRIRKVTVSTGIVPTVAGNGDNL
jgi:NHL repeat